MRSFSWAVLAAAFLVTAVQAQSSAAIADAIAASGVNVANVPDCAKVCLSNSTQYATDCAQIDVKCLCNSQSYVNALSCCLATNCDATDQQTAIQFNIQECAAVNSSAPQFVGCSPFSLTTGGTNSKTVSSSSTSTENTAVTTLTGALATVPTAYTNTRIGTASFSGGSLLTGSCTVPLFAQITDAAQSTIQFPQVGCALNRGSCCPYDPNEYAGLTKCPDDYATSSGACCPNGYSVYYTALGAETPCYSKPTKTFLPATTITGSQATVITDTVFSRRYTLVKQPAPVLPKGSVAGIVINAVLLVAAPFIIVWLLRRYKRNKANKAERAAAEQAQRESTGATFPPIEPTLTQQMSEVPASTASLTTPAELGSPDTGFSTPATLKGMPFPSGLAQNTPSSPPAYEVPGSVLFEMSGSTYIHEHHPAFGGSSTDLSREPASPPRTPPKSPAATASSRSPVLSPSSPFRADSPGTSNIVITPLGSPGPLTSHSPGTRFREQM